jgi:hypothetical protein
MVRQTPLPARCRRRLATASLSALAATGALALPVGFKDSTMAMGSLGRDWRETALVYSFTAQDAIGIDMLSLQYPSMGNTQRLDAVSAQYNRRLVRWNLPQAQANIYLLTGLGAARGSVMSATQTMLNTGLQIDYETRRIYTAAQWRGYYTRTFKGRRSSVAAGFSFYPTEYDEWQPWAILEVEKMGGDFQQTTQVTPYLRLLHNTLFIEAGVPVRRGKSDGIKVNFRYTF